MIHRYIIEVTDEVKGFDEAIAKLDREWGIEELKPCEDAISRAEALRIAKSYYHAEYVVDKIRQLPSVTPKAEPCEDAISRQDAVDIINGYAEQFNGYIGTPNDTEVYAYARGLLLSIERNISALPPVTPEAKWIPVSEKLPEPLTAVLLTVRYKSTGHWTYQMGYWEDTLEKWEKWIEIGTLDDEFEILAWMELPEKYEEDNHE